MDRNILTHTMAPTRHVRLQCFFATAGPTRRNSLPEPVSTILWPLSEPVFKFWLNTFPFEERWPTALTSDNDSDDIQQQWDVNRSSEQNTCEGVNTWLCVSQWLAGDVNSGAVSAIHHADQLRVCVPRQNVQLLVVSETFLLVEQFAARHASHGVFGRRVLTQNVICTWRRRRRRTATARRRVHRTPTSTLSLQSHLYHVCVAVLRRTALPSISPQTTSLHFSLLLITPMQIGTGKTHD